jgi:hypothetical protein
LQDVAQVLESQFDAAFHGARVRGGRLGCQGASRGCKPPVRMAGANAAWNRVLRAHMAEGQRDAAMATQFALTLGISAAKAGRTVQRLFQRADLWSRVEAAADALVAYRTLTAAEITALVRSSGERMA